MSIHVRHAQERGYANHGWLESYHSFSFADYYDPEHMGVSRLRVINEDRVQPGAGFPTHPHEDMEIISYVLSGALEHKDSMGNTSTIHAGDVQRMSAGTGVVHSEYNASKDEMVHFLQIWVLPDSKGIAPSYEQIHFSDEQKRGRWCLLLSADERDDALKIHQDVALYGSLLSESECLDYQLAPQRCAYLHLARGEGQIKDVHLQAGDAVTITEGAFEFCASSDAELLLFDLPK